MICNQVRLMHEAGFQLGNLDATIILQRPKLSPHKGNIIASICKILDAHPSVVNIKVCFDPVALHALLRYHLRCCRPVYLAHLASDRHKALVIS